MMVESPGGTGLRGTPYASMAIFFFLRDDASSSRLAVSSTLSRVEATGGVRLDASSFSSASIEASSRPAAAAERSIFASAPQAAGGSVATAFASSAMLTLGTRITGVDNLTYSGTGEAFSHIVLPNTDQTTPVLLQSDDTSTAYEFAKKFPGYTASNITEKGIHSVPSRRFHLVAADHPLVSALSENTDKLQTGEISMMPEGLVKISSNLFDTVMPMVREQVDSQIKVRNLSTMQVALSPAESSGLLEVSSEGNHLARTEV
jgi:hypothetical protein